MFLTIWLLPIAILSITVVLGFPLSRYLAWIMNGEYKAPKFLRWFEERLDSGPQNWKQYAASLILFNTTLFAFSFLVLFLQPWMPFNADGKGMLAPTTIFHSVISFITNSDLQHYSGDQHFSNFSQMFFGITNFFLSASIGFCALTAMIRAFRSDKTVGNFFVDMWRVVMYMFLPIAFIFSIFFLQQGAPMTYQSSVSATTLEVGSMGITDKGAPKPQNMVVGPVAAFEPMKQIGTNGGGFFGMNSAHPFENPTALTNFLSCVGMMLFPYALVLMFGRMLGRLKHAVIVFGVMFVLMIGTVVWAVYFDTYQPNPGLTAHPTAKTYELASASATGSKKTVTLPEVAGLPVDQHLGNLEGKEMRFGTSAGATFAALTVDVTCGAVNCEHDSLNPIASISPMLGMWLNCIFGGKGVGMINMLLYIIIGIFVAGMMVGRTPEYLGKKIGAREVTLVVIALLIHPLMILFPSGLFAATSWGLKAMSNPAAHGFTQIFYQFSSASANNGSAFDGLGVTYGFANAATPGPTAWILDIATALVMLISRMVPLIAPMAMAGYLGAKKTAPFGLGSLRIDTATFGFLLLATILIIGALLFLPIAALGPIAEHLGPIPFGG